MLITLLAILTHSLSQVAHISFCTPVSQESLDQAETKRKPKVYTQLLSKPAPGSGSGVTQSSYGSTLLNTAPKVQEQLFRQMEKNMQDFCLSYPRNPMQSLITESTQPPSSLNSQALTESLFLTLLRRPEFPFIFHLFSFLPERERRVGLLCTTNERDFVAVYQIVVCFYGQECIPEFLQK